MLLMHNLHVLNETLNYGYSSYILSIFSFISILCGILVIVNKNPIVSVLYLIGLFLSISGYIIILGLNFIGISYLLVYIGAVSILFLFILMLINIRISELTTDTNNSIPLAVLIGIYLNIPLYQILPFTNINYDYLNFISNNDYVIYDNNLKSNETIKDVSYVTSKLWDGNLAETSHITSIGNVMYTSYSIWLIITSIILLLAMVGAIVITIKEKN